MEYRADDAVQYVISSGQSVAEGARNLGIVEAMLADAARRRPAQLRTNTVASVTAS